MNIFILPGTLHGDNLGDVAMLQVALARLKKIWPDATLHVLTEDAGRLKQFCPAAEPVAWLGFYRWLAASTLPRPFFPNIPEKIRRQFPLRYGKILPLTRLLTPRYRVATRQFARAFFNADLVVMAGCGLINDAFKPQAARMLAALAAAQAADIPTAMLGQGIGPLTDPELRTQAAIVLPGVDLIFLRERITSLELLQNLSVSENKIMLTGDEAVELAFNERPVGGGDGIGINLRQAAYAGLDEAALPVVREIISAKSRQAAAPLVGLPIYTGPKNSDVQIITELVGAENSGSDLNTPLGVIRRTATCRIVVTGSYHAAVFALAQGIPVVSIAQSRYYAEKFRGLAGEFDGGCTVLFADEPTFAAKLTAAVDVAWAEADEWRPRLLRAAERQIQSAHAAYTRLPELLAHRSPPAGK